MIHSYLPVLLMVAVAVGFPLGLLAVTSMLGPRVRSTVKNEPYECGIPTFGTTHERMPVKFYRVAILFLLFDVEAAFLFPWAVIFRKQLMEWGASFLLGELALFLLVLLVGYVAVWKRGSLEWD